MALPESHLHRRPHARLACVAGLRRALVRARAGRRRGRAARRTSPSCGSSSATRTSRSRASRRATAGSSSSTPAASGCRSTATTAPRTRSCTTTARSSTTASATTTSACRSRCARSYGDAEWVAIPEKRFETRAVRGVLSAPAPPARELAIALARELLHGCGALSVSIALDAEPPAVIECMRLGPVVVHELDAEHELPHDAAADVVLPRAAAHAPASAVRRRCRRPARSQACSAASRCSAAPCATSPRCCPARRSSRRSFETSDPDLPLGLAGRPGDPVAVLIGEHEFELDL